MKQLFKLLLILFVILGIVLAVGGFFVYQQFLPVNATATQKQRVVIARGDSITKIGQKLSDLGIIKHPLVFRFVVSQKKLGSSLQAGSFLLSPNMTVWEVANELTKGTEDVWITVLEGWRTEEVAEYLDSLQLDFFNKADFLSQAKSQEGFLFPDTYLIPKTATATSLFNLFKDTFEKKVEKGLSEQIEQSDRSLAELVTLASIVQREAREPEQMKMVAGILWRRIELGMGLDVDATLQYIQGYSPTLKSWWAPPSVATKSSTSLYNTYKYAGLPPGPISNPGLDALKAVLNPIKTKNLFYLHDAQGEIHYAETVEQHNRNVQKYLR